MKKILAVLLCLSFISLIFSACGKADTPDNGSSANMVNPVEEYSSLDEINKAAGTKLVSPDDGSLSAESFSVISNSISQYKFTLGGCEYCFRASAESDDDISGIYLDNGKTAFEGQSESGAVAASGEFKAFRFFVDGIQYVLSVNDNNSLDADYFNRMGEKLQNSVIKAVSSPEVTKLAGQYQDSYTKRATAEVKLYDKDAVEITIKWASSASQEDVWSIKAVKDGDRLTYTADSIAHTRTEEDNQTELKDFGAGYFEITEAGICWTGSGVESTEKCVFETVQ